MPDRKVTVVLGLNAAPYVAGGQQAVSTNTRIIESARQVGTSTESMARQVNASTESMRGGFSRSALAAALFSGNISKVFQIAGGVVAAQAVIRGTQLIVSGIKDVVSAGAEWTESITKTQFAFGAASNIILFQADQMAKQLGVDKQQFVDNAAAIGLIGTAAGLSQPAAAAFGAQFEKLAVDVSSFYNVPVAQALDAIQSGLVGQERPLRQYGVLLDQAAVKQEAVRLGLAKQGQELTQQTAVLARASLITAGFAAAEGDLARTHESLANRFRAITGDVHNYEIELGDKARPALLHLLDDAGQLGTALEHDLGPTLESGGHALAGIGATALATGHNLGSLVGSAAGLAGAFTLPALGGAASLLGDVADAASHNQIVIDALTISIASRFVPALLVEAQTLGVIAVTNVADTLSGVAAATATTVSAMGGLVAERGVLRAAMIGLGFDRAAATATSLETALARLAAAEAMDALAAENAAAAMAGFDVELGATGTAAAGATAATGEAAAGVGGLGAAATGASGALSTMLGPIGLLTAGVLVLGRNFQATDKDISKLIQSARDGKNLQTESGLQGYISSLKDLRTQLDAGPGNNSETWVEKLFGKVSHDPVTAQIEAYQNAGSEIEKTQKQLDDYNTHVAQAAAATGLTKDQVIALAQANGVNLVSAGKSAIGFLVQLAGAMNSATGAATGLVNGVLTLSNSQKALASNLNSFDPLSDLLSADQKADTKAASTSTETPADRADKLAQARLGVERANLSLSDSERALHALQNGGLERELASAIRDVSAARDAVTRSEFQQLDAEQKLADLEDAQRSGRSLDELNIALQRAQIRKDQADLATQQASQKKDYATAVGIPEEVKSATDDYNSSLLDQREAAYAVADAQTAVNRAQGDNGTIARQVQAAQLDVNDAQRASSSALDAQIAAQMKLNDLMNGGLVEEMAKANLDYRDALQGVVTAQNAVIDAQKKATDQSASNDPSQKPKTTLAEYLKSLGTATDTTKGYYTDLATIASTGRTDVLNQLTQLGTKGTDIVHDLARKVTTDPGGFQDMADQISHYSVIGSESFKAAFIKNLTEGGDASKLLTTDMIDYIADETGTGADRVQSIMSEWAMDLVTSVNQVLTATGQPNLPVPNLVANTGNQPNEAVAPNQHFKPLPLASGGVLDAHITQQPTILYGERETGQEAFIPQRGGSFAKMKDVLSTAASWYGLGITKMAGGGLLPAEPNFQGYGDLSRGGQAAADYARNAAELYAALAQANQALGGVLGGPPSGAVPGNVTDWLTSALRLTGTALTELAGLSRLAMTESGGNPHSYNQTGVPNGVHGVEHAEGLLQMLPSTFLAHALAAHLDIWNPVDNAASAIGYIHGRYGSVYDTPLSKGGAYKGYAFGGINVFDNGGWLMPGRLGLNMTSTPERVLSPAQTTLYSSGSARPVSSYSIEIQVMAPGGIITDHPTFAKEMKKVVEPAIQRAFDSLATEGDTR